LTFCYITLSLDDIAAKVGLEGGAEEAKKELVAMVKRREIMASIDEATGMVRFEDDSSSGGAGSGSEASADAAAMERLLAATGAVAELAKKVEALDIQMLRNPSLHGKSRGARGVGVASTGDFGAFGVDDDYATSVAMAESLHDMS
jgi:hypothetical protein